jgi:hypothetical protein
MPDTDITYVAISEYRKEKCIGSQWKADISITTMKSQVSETLKKMEEPDNETVYGNISAQLMDLKDQLFRYYIT